MINNPLIQIQNVCAGYGSKQVLEDVSLTVYEHDFLGIIGPNGGGKTTLLKIILGLRRPQSGSIKFFHEGKEVNKLRMGYLPQYSSFDKKFPITVQEVILSGCMSSRWVCHDYNRAEKEKASSMLEQLGLEDYSKKTMGQLSGGQRQRVLIGRALMCDPKVLILDEPNTYIDRQHQERLYNLLAELNERHAIVLVSHDVGTVLRNVKNIACINRHAHYHPSSEVNGEVLEQVFGCPFELIAHGHIPHRILEEHED